MEEKRSELLLFDDEYLKVALQGKQSGGDEKHREEEKTFKRGRAGIEKLKNMN